MDLHFNYNSKNKNDRSLIDCWFSTILTSSLRYLAEHERDKIIMERKNQSYSF